MKKKQRKIDPLLYAPFSDIDRDGVPNVLDCQPLNPKKHGVEPNILMRQRLEKLPIYVTNQKIPYGDETEDVLYEMIDRGEIYPLFSEKARRLAPKARKTALSVLKTAPDLISIIKRKRPKYIIFTSQAYPEGVVYGGEEITVGGFAVRIFGRAVILYQMPSSWYKKFEHYKKEGVRKPVSLRTAATLRHELEHVGQFREEKKIGKRVTKKMFSGPYEEQRGERQAYRAEKKFIKKHKEKKKFFW